MSGLATIALAMAVVLLSVPTVLVIVYFVAGAVGLVLHVVSARRPRTVHEDAGIRFTCLCGSGHHAPSVATLFVCGCGRRTDLRVATPAPTR